MKFIRLILGLVLFFTPFAIMEKGHAQGMDVYTVKPGDTLWIIAQKYQVGLSEIINANKQFKNPALIYPGQKVNVPLLTEVKSVEGEVIRLVNVERSKRGLKPLTHNWQLSRCARVKSEDMRNKNYFSHTSPTYGSPFNMIKAFNIPYSTAGENIAAGQPTPQQVMNMWMNSAGHRANILNPNFTQIGVGYASGGGSYRYYWTQMFIRP